jgi:outer membrane protein assembly factor BamB
MKSRMDRYRCLAMLLTPLLLAAGACPLHGGERAPDILSAAGVQGGLVVHVGCGDGRLTAALHASDRYLVHGLARRAEDVRPAREHVRKQGLAGQVAIDQLRGPRLPYPDNLVRLAISEDLGTVPMAEVMRALCPGGVAYVKQDGTWQKHVKPWPEEIDEWTHALHGPDNNAVSRDTVVGPPRHLQWVGGPRWARSHDHLSSVSVVVSSAGRLFAIVDEGPAAAVALPAQWRLVARDAFSGVVLWKRTVEPWEGHLRGFRSGPAAIQRRLVAVGDTVYVTLGYGKPVTALDAATGEIQRTYEGTEDALEIICSGGVLTLVVGPALSHGAARTEHKGMRRVAYESPDGKKLMAIKADSGEVLWTKDDEDTDSLMPTALAVSDEKVFFQNPEGIVCLEAASGKRLWRAERPVTTSRWAWTAPTLVVHDGVVLSADRDAASKVTKPEEGEVQWVVYSGGGQAPPGELIAFSAHDGKRLWSTKAREAYNAPVDVLVADGLVWTGILVRANEPGITRGLDPATGEVRRTRPPDQKFFRPGMGHHRCHRNKATERYLVLGRSGVEFIDVKTGEGIADHWVRGACQYGVMPCNGLLYAPSHSCACYIEAKLNGFNALAPARSESPGPHPVAEDPLEKGPAYGAAADLESEITDADWPTYRHDGARSGRASSQIPAQLESGWTANLGGELTSPVVAAGKVFVAQVQKHTMHALDAASGKPVWSRVVGGRVGSPPTIYRGLCLFGCRDGYVYCLDASSGQLIWRFRAAPQDQRIVAYNQLESVWPVPGNVLIHHGSAYVVAGRCSYVDGGMVLYKLDPVTGEVQAQARLYDRDPETGQEPQKNVRGVSMPGALPDVLASDGTSVYLRHHRFDADLQEQAADVPHLFAPAGFLDGSWWHRTYWLFGTRMRTGWGGWTRAGRRATAGRIMVMDENTLYAFGRLNQYNTSGTHVGLPPAYHPWGSGPKVKPHYVLFASGKDPEVVKEGKGRRARREIKPRWTCSTDFWVRAMVLADDTLFLAGPHSPFEDEQPKGPSSASGKRAALWALSPKDGSRVAEYALDAPPAWDGMAAARGKLYLTDADGVVLCLTGSKR